MADPEYVRIFVVSDVATTYKLLTEIQLLLGRQVRRGSSGASATRSRIVALQRQVSLELDALARATAIDATDRIKKQLRLKRPATGNTLGLKRVVRSYPLPRIHGFATGAVGVASVAWLNKAVNPLDPKARPYWEAIESGTRKHLGRRLRGWFFDSHAGYDDPEEPRAIYRNIASPPHGVFVPGAKAQAMGLTGGKGGKGVIRTPLRAKHFIRDGANLARTDWKVGINAIQASAIAELRALGL